MLSRHGYSVQDRPVNVAANRARLIELGFLSVPVVEVAGRAFAGFPVRNLTVNLGLARARLSAAATHKVLAEALDALESVADTLPQLPASMWTEQAYPLQPERNHTFGHFTWGMFRFLELTLLAPARGGLPWEDLKDSVQNQDWRAAHHFASFQDVRGYAEPLLERASVWRRGIAVDALRQPLETPWGGLELHVLIGILGEHTEIKRDHLLKRLAAG